MQHFFLRYSISAQALISCKSPLPGLPSVLHGMKGRDWLLDALPISHILALKCFRRQDSTFLGFGAGIGKRPKLRLRWVITPLCNTVTERRGRGNIIQSGFVLGGLWKSASSSFGRGRRAKMPACMQRGEGAHFPFSLPFWAAVWQMESLKEEAKVEILPSKLGTLADAPQDGMAAKGEWKVVIVRVWREAICLIESVGTKEDRY